MKKITRLVGSICLLLMMILCPLHVEAASFTVSSVPSTVEPNAKFKISIGGECAGRVNISVENGSASESAIWVENNSVSVTITAGGSGNVVVKVSPQTGMTDLDGNIYSPGSVTRTATIKEKAPAAPTNKEETSTTKKEETQKEEPKSGNNNLASLSVSGGSLVPVFHADTTSYKVSLSAETTSATITAKVSDAKATVSGTGDKTLKAGDNIFEVVCTAENGKTKTYTVNLYVDETPFVYADYKGQQLGVVRNQEGIGFPETFEETTVTLSEKSVQAYHSNQYNTTILYMVNESGEKNFYMYEEEKGITSVFRPVSFLGRNVVLYDLTEEEQIRENMTYQEVTVEGIQMNGWVYATPGYENFVQIPVMNEFGEKVIYQHETTENSLQLYKEYVAPVVEEEEETKGITLDFMYLYIAIGVVGLLVLILLILIVKYNKLRKYNRMM